jgi:hypothetical protein
MRISFHVFGDCLTPKLRQVALSFTRQSTSERSKDDGNVSLVFMLL